MMIKRLLPRMLLMPCSPNVDFVYLDSGTGGIPYLHHMKEVFPEANCVYVGDTANFPYGEKSHDEIVKADIEVCKKIIEKFNPKVIIIACNTMSVNALDVLRDVYPDTQFVGTVPAIKLAASISKKRVIGLLATNSTVNHPYNQDLKNHYASDCKMILRGDPELISFIEHDSFTATKEEIIDACRPAIDFFRKQGCDAVILGCTHFLNLKKEILEICSPDIQVVDSVEGVTNRALSLFKGVAGMCPAQGVAEKKVCEADTFGAQGAFPLLYVTGFSDKKDEKEYDVICERYKLKFGGILK